MTQEKRPTFIVGGIEVDANGRPVAQQTGATPAPTPEQLATLKRELEEARTALAKAEEEGGAVRAQAATLRDRLKISEQLQVNYAGLVEELDALKAQPILPADALQRIKDVKGVGDTLAPVILTALTAPARAD